MAQSDPGKLRLRYPQHPQNPGGMRQPRPHLQGAQQPVIKPMMQYQQNASQMGHQQQYMFQSRMPHYGAAQPQYSTGNIYYVNQAPGAVYPAYGNPQYNANVYPIQGAVQPLPVSSTNPVPQQLASGWQQSIAVANANTGAQVIHNQAVNQPPQPLPPKKEKKQIVIRDPKTLTDVTDTIVGQRSRTQSGGVSTKQETSEQERDSSEDKERQKKEEKDKAIALFRATITSTVNTKDEEHNHAEAEPATTTTTAQNDDTSVENPDDKNICNDYEIVSLPRASEETVEVPLENTNKSETIEKAIVPCIESVAEIVPEQIPSDVNGDTSNENGVPAMSAITVNDNVTVESSNASDTCNPTLEDSPQSTEKPVEAIEASDAPITTQTDEKPATEIEGCNDVDVSSKPVDEEEATTESVPLVQAPRKKKQKQRLKEMSAKGEREANGNLMDAFVDKPAEEVSQEPAEPKEDVAPSQEPQEEETWEEKAEFAVDNVKSLKPTTNGTPADENEDDSADKKRQYSRDFLLQFAKNCTSKPDGLPEMDIVLKKPHCLTEPLNQDQKQEYNDFAPQYFRQQSGGRHSGAGRQKGSRGGPLGAASQPKKVIAAPAIVDVELRRTENKWVRPSEQKKDMDSAELEKEEMYRKTRGILNKLTPQNFETLVIQMKELKIRSIEQMKEIIEIVFEKAISEPGFSVAYARMCQELSETKISNDDKTFTFRGLLLNRCQQEFLKEREVEQQMLADKDKKFDTPEEAQQWKEIVELKEMKARRCALGNVRFIGELYKLKMLRESIMHECVSTLLNKNDEEYLEWLSKLLTTIGQGLSQTSSKDNKAKMVMYFEKIALHSKDKKISSRVRFMLQDLIELKDNNWVSRREDNNPKTIDQIREEIKTKSRQQEVSAKIERNERRNRGGGRDSPVIGKAGGSQSGEWTPARKGKTHSQVDANKFKAIRHQQFSNSEVSLGPSRGHQTWAKGSSGGSASYGNGPPMPQENRGHNRFDILGSADGRQDMDNRDRHSTGKRSAEQERERAAAISATREFARSSPRSRSPAMRTTEDRPKKNNAPAPPPEEPIVSDEKLEISTRATIKEYLCNNDIKEAIQCIQDLKAIQKHHLIMSTLIGDAVDSSPKDCKQTSVVLDALLNSIISKDAFSKGLQSLLCQSVEIIVDIPHLWNMLGTLLSTAVANNTLTLSDLRKIADASLDNKAALGLYMAEILAAVVKQSSEKQALELWQKSGIKWDMLFKDNAKLEDVIKKTKLQFTTNTTPRLPIELFNSEGTNEDKLLKWLKDNVASSQKPSIELINDIALSVCRVSVLEGSKFTKTPFEEYTNLLREYVTPHEDYRLHLLHVAQKVADSLDYPKGLLREMFEALYNYEIVEDNTVFDWENSNHVSNRKNVALKDVEAFLGWIHGADDSSSTKDSNDRQ